MEKRSKIKFLISFIFLLAFALSFTSAALLNTSLITPATSVQAGSYQIYNISVNNTNNPAGINFTQINITAPINATAGIVSFNTSLNISNYNYTLTNTSTTATLSWTNTTSRALLTNGSLAYIWFNTSISQTGNYTVTILTTDTSGNTNTTNVNFTIIDTIAPSVSITSPVNGSSLGYSYIPLTASVTDNGQIGSVTITLSNATTGNVFTIYTNTSSSVYPSYSYNFTALSNGIYSINVTANDTSGNINSAAANITINATICTPSWSCGAWGACNSTFNQTRTCTDSNSCGLTTNEPVTVQSCTPTVSCSPQWNCTAWTPDPCTVDENQTQFCTNMNSSDGSGCQQIDNRTRPCVISGSTTQTNSNSQQQNSLTSYSSVTFFVIIGVIVLIVAGVAIVLMRLKKKAGSRSFSNSGNTSPPGPPGYPPRINPGPSASSFPPNSFRPYS